MYAGRRQVVLLCVTVCLVLGALTGCGLGTPTPEPVTISFSFPAADTEYYGRLLGSFGERHPHITVELRPRGWYAPNIDAGDAEVFAASQFETRLLYDQGELQSLAPFIEQDGSDGTVLDLADFYPGTLDLFSQGGSLWAIPATVDVTVMYYNRDLFDQYDVPYPESGWTWDEFLDTALALRDPGAGTFGYAPGQDTFAWLPGQELLDALAVIYQHGGRLYDDQQDPMRATFDDPLTIEAMEWYAGLYTTHDVAPTPRQVRESYGAGGLTIAIDQGKVGMWTGMLSRRGGGSSLIQWRMRWGMVPLPRGARSSTLALVDGYAISAIAPHPQACWQWIAFLSEQLPARHVPARSSLAQSAAYAQLVGSDVAAIAKASMDDVLVLSPELDRLGPTLRTFMGALQAVINERATPEQALLAAQRRFESR